MAGRTSEAAPTRLSAAAPEQRVLWIDVPDETAGLHLIERLRFVHAELAPARGDECCRVAVELREQLTDDVVSRVLDFVRAWAMANGVEAAQLELDQRVYVVPA